MVPIIIPLFLTERQKEHATATLDQHVAAAWEFAYNALWPGQHLNEREVEQTKNFIHEYFDEASDRKRAFIALCQRVILTQRFVNNATGRYVPTPSVWFNRYYRYGFAGTLDWLYSVEQQRKNAPGYLAHVEMLASDYYDYAIKSGKQLIRKCRLKLLRYHAACLLKHLFGFNTSHTNL